MGYAPDKWDGLLKYMRQKGYSYEELYEANLANKSTKDDRVRYYDAFRNRAMVPIIDVRGNVVAFGGRVLDDSKPKYINSSDTLVYKKSLGVFGLNFAKNSKENRLILVEGYMDAITLHQAGFDNVIACLGTAFTGEMAHLLARYSDEILLCYDSDEAGQKATKRALGVLNSIGMKVRVVHLSGGKDPDEILRKYGPERVRSLIDGAANDIEYALLSARNGLDLATSDGKMKYLDAVAEILASTKNNIAQDIYSSRLAEELSVSKESITARINQIGRKKKYAEDKNKFRKIQQEAMREATKAEIANDTNIKVLKSQEMLIAFLYYNPDKYRFVEDDITAEDFSVGDNKAIFRVLCERIKGELSLEFTFFTESLTPEQMSAFVKMCKINQELVSSEKVCYDCIQTIKNSKKKSADKPSVVALSDEEYLKLFNKKQNKQ
jgi:DNA primase